MEVVTLARLVRPRYRRVAVHALNARPVMNRWGINAIHVTPGPTLKMVKDANHAHLVRLPYSPDPASVKTVPVATRQPIPAHAASVWLERFPLTAWNAFRALQGRHH